MGKEIVYMSRKNKAIPEQADTAEKTPHTKKRTNWILCIGAIAFVIMIAVMIVNQNVQIYDSQKQLEEIEEQIDLQKIQNSELKDVADAVEKEDFDKYRDYIEKRARMYGFTKDGEVVFINIAGN